MTWKKREGKPGNKTPTNPAILSLSIIDHRRVSTTDYWPPQLERVNFSVLSTRLFCSLCSFALSPLLWNPLPFFPKMVSTIPFLATPMFNLNLKLLIFRLKMLNALISGHFFFHSGDSVLLYVIWENYNRKLGMPKFWVFMFSLCLYVS